ncbi:hypothetical protein [Vineibacter terrae]|uniref:hypothetical protein n=1 Tax=Vineibacter terrae TaxID=2586908 RepID=UPI0015B3BE98
MPDFAVESGAAFLPLDLCAAGFRISHDAGLALAAADGAAHAINVQRGLALAIERIVGKRCCEPTLA